MKPDKAIHLNDRIYLLFARYYNRPGNSAWGIFHTQLDDGNYKFDAALGHYTSRERREEEIELIEIFNRLTPSQRRKLGRKAEHLSKIL